MQTVFTQRRIADLWVFGVAFAFAALAVWNISVARADTCHFECAKTGATNRFLDTGACTRRDDPACFTTCAETCRSFNTGGVTGWDCSTLTVECRAAAPPTPPPGTPPGTPPACTATPPAPQQACVPTVSVTCTTNADCATACGPRCADAVNSLGWPATVRTSCAPSYAPVCADVGGGRHSCSFWCINATPVLITPPSTAIQGPPPTGNAPPPTAARLGPPLRAPTDLLARGAGSSIPRIVGTAVRFLAGLAGALFLASFIYGGILWMISGGDPKRVGSARKALVNSAIGITIVLLSYSFLSVVLSYLATL